MATNCMILLWCIRWAFGRIMKHSTTRRRLCNSTITFFLKKINITSTGNGCGLSVLSECIKQGLTKAFPLSFALVPYMQPLHPKRSDLIRLHLRRPTSWASVVPVLIALLATRSNDAVMVLKHTPIILIRRFHDICRFIFARTSNVRLHIKHRVYISSGCAYVYG